MLSLYQQHFSFKAVMFSTSKSIRLYCKYHSIRVVSSFTVNMHGLPVLKNMILSTRLLYTAHLVGYMNSDILFSPSLFDMMRFLLSEEQKGAISPAVSTSSFHYT